MSNPLSDPYSIYIVDSSLGESYESTLKKIAKVSTVEEFWRVFSHLNSIQNLEIKEAYHVFRGDSRAMREDEDNKDGGSFLIRISKQNPSLGPSLWEKVLLCLIGGQLPRDVVGITISPRPKFYVLTIWHQHTGNEEEIKQMCTEIVESVGVPHGFKIEHTIFKEGGKNQVTFAVKDEHPPQKKQPQSQ